MSVLAIFAWWFDLPLWREIAVILALSYLFMGISWFSAMLAGDQDRSMARDFCEFGLAAAQVLLLLNKTIAPIAFGSWIWLWLHGWPSTVGLWPTVSQLLLTTLQAISTFADPIPDVFFRLIYPIIFALVWLAVTSPLMALASIALCRRMEAGSIFGMAFTAVALGVAGSYFIVSPAVGFVAKLGSDRLTSVMALVGFFAANYAAPLLIFSGVAEDMGGRKVGFWRSLLIFGTSALPLVIYGYLSESYSAA